METEQIYKSKNSLLNLIKQEGVLEMQVTTCYGDYQFAIKDRKVFEEALEKLLPILICIG